MPLRGRMITRPSFASRCNASRTGVRPILKRCRQHCSDKNVARLEPQRDDLFLDRPVRLIGQAFAAVSGRTLAALGGRRLPPRAA